MLTSIAFLFTLALALWAAVEDFRGLQIPNFISLGILISFIAAWAFDMGLVGGAWWHPFAIAFGVFLISYIMFAVNIMGAGDSKLATVLSLWLGFKALLIFLFYMSLIGGILGLMTLLIRKKKPFKNISGNGWINQVQNGRNAVPYGIAITFGFLAAAIQSGAIKRYVFL